MRKNTHVELLVIFQISIIIPEGLEKGVRVIGRGRNLWIDL